MHLKHHVLTAIIDVQDIYFGDIVNKNKDMLTYIAVLSSYTQKELGFICKS